MSLASATAWIVQRALRDADASNQLVVHTQEVLLSAEGVLLRALEAQNSAQTYVETGNPADNEGFTLKQNAQPLSPSIASLR